MTPRKIKQPLELLKADSIAEWSLEEIEKGFLTIRDFKYLPCSNVPGNKRAIPWLYVDNGCFLRAALSRRILKDKGFPAIKKLFVFGNFKCQTKWSQKGYITFKDHVGVAVKYKEDIFVLDPSVNYEKPLNVIEWLNILTKLSSNKSIEFSLCSSLTLSHNANCNEQNLKNEIGFRKGIPYTIEYFTMEFLAKEYQNIIALGMNPTEILY